MPRLIATLATCRVRHGKTFLPIVYSPCSPCSSSIVTHARRIDSGTPLDHCKCTVDAIVNTATFSDLSHLKSPSAAPRRCQHALSKATIQSHTGEIITSHPGPRTAILRPASKGNFPSSGIESRYPSSARKMGPQERETCVEGVECFGYGTLVR